MKDLIKRVDNWAKEKEITDKGNYIAQYGKMQEEVAEFGTELTYMQFSKTNKEYNQAKERAKMELGDVLVTAIIESGFLDTTIEECLEMALNKIENRTGKMKNGTFVKD